MKKRILSMMLVLCMVLGMMPTAFAEDDTSGSVDVTTFADLKTALEAAAAADSGDTTINILNNITLAEGESWSAVNIDGYHGADTITIHGNGHTISGLDAPLFSGGFAGGSGLVVDQLTLDSVTINDFASSTGVGAFIGSVDSMDVVSLTDCHLTNSTIICTGGPRVGGLIGWTSGYNNQNDGPVDTRITIDNCSVENCEITSNGSVGGLIGHAGANPATYHTIRNCTVTGNTLTSTDDGGWRVGIVVGTANVGELAMDGITESGNTLAQTDKEAPANTLYGRFVPGDTGTLTIDGTPIFGSDIVAQNGSSGYKTLSAAVDAAATGDTITLLTDISEDVTIPEGKDITLDLAGHTMTVPSDCGIEVLGLLTVTDTGESGTITCTDTPIRVNGSGAKFTLESGAVISTDDYGIYAKDNGTAVVNGGSISSKDAALSGNNTTGDMNFEVHGGTIAAAQGPAIYMPGQVSLTITDGTLNGGISLRMGQVNISGGIINSITENIDSPSEYYGYSGNAWFPDALYVFGGTYTSENATYGNSLDLNITGGTFNCLNDQGSAIAIYDLGKVAQEENISISGDAKLTSTSTSRKSYQVLSLDDIGVTDSAYGANSGKVSTTITGGTFTTDPSDYLEDDYQAVLGKDELYTVKPVYTVTVDEKIENGKVTVKPEKASMGDTVTVTAAPEEGYELDTITVASGDQNVEVTDGKFTMPAGNVTVSATFQKSVYTVSVDKNIQNGKVTVKPEKASMGDTVTVTAAPEEGYELDAITVTSGKTAVTVKDGKFTMPAGNVTVSATFKKAAAPSPEPSVSTTTTVSTDVSTDIPSADKKAIEAVLDDASVEGIEKAADTGDILDAAGVTEADTKAKQVEIKITTKVVAEGADLSAGTLTFSAAPVATITIDGKKVSKDVPVTNDMLNGKNITIKLPLPKDFVPEEIIHISNDGLRQRYTAQDFKVETAENGGQVAVLKITHFSQFILNAKTHVHTWDQGTVITEPTATTDGTMHYVCTVCGDEKDEVIPAVPATQLTLDPPSVRLAAGKTQALTLTVVPENATGTVIWSSSNPAVATVDETGNVTAAAAGTTTITAVLGTQTAVATVSVVCGTDTCQYYTDVDAGAWYHPAVDFVTEHKLMQGVDAKARTFVPGHELTRAQLAQVLYNMENPGNTASEKSFKDVKQGAWYYNAVIWAADNGIVKGYEDGRFYPNRPITREQMVTMLYRYMQFKGFKVDASSEDWKSFTDYAKVDSWAQDAMAWAVHNGVVNGLQNNQLAPTHTAQRSQVAKIIMEITIRYNLA